MPSTTSDPSASAAPIRYDLAKAFHWALEIPDDALLNRDEAVLLLTTIGMPTTAGTLALWRHLGRGPSWFKAGRKVSYRAGDLREYVRQQHAANLRQAVA